MEYALELLELLKKKPVKKCIPLYSKYTINTQTELFP